MGHAGLGSCHGNIVILHVPTGDVWSLDAVMARRLHLARLIDGRKIPSRLESRVKALREAATARRAGVLAPVHPNSDILVVDWVQRVADGEWGWVSDQHPTTTHDQKHHTTP